MSSTAYNHKELREWELWIVFTPYITSIMELDKLLCLHLVDHVDIFCHLCGLINIKYNWE